MRGRKYQLRFKFFDTETEAKNFCNKENAEATYYMRKHNPAQYTPWNSIEEPGKYIAWYME